MRVPEAVSDLERELADMFGPRFQSLVVYGSPLEHPGGPAATLVVIDGLTTGDLAACSARVAGWHDNGLATPLLLSAHEFPRALDVFPLEFGAILADHVVVSGVSPFDGLQVDRQHLRHACEIQARSHLLHLREGYVETGGRGDAVADLILRSAEPLAALLKSVARLLQTNIGDASQAVGSLERELGLSTSVLSDVIALGVGGPVDVGKARGLIAPYLDAVERLVQYLDRWTEP